MTIARRPSCGGSSSSRALWLVFSLLVFQFDETSVAAISILVGVACLGAAAFELAAVPASDGLWRVGRIILAIAFAIVGVVAFVNPGDGFDALARSSPSTCCCAGSSRSGAR